MIGCIPCPVRTCFVVYMLIWVKSQAVKYSNQVRDGEKHEIGAFIVESGMALPEWYFHRVILNVATSMYVASIIVFTHPHDNISPII